MVWVWIGFMMFCAPCTRAIYFSKRSLVCVPFKALSLQRSSGGQSQVEVHSPKPVDLSIQRPETHFKPRGFLGTFWGGTERPLFTLKRHPHEVLGPSGKGQRMFFVLQVLRKRHGHWRSGVRAKGCPLLHAPQNRTEKKLRSFNQQKIRADWRLDRGSQWVASLHFAWMLGL